MLEASPFAPRPLLLPLLALYAVSFGTALALNGASGDLFQAAENGPIEWMQIVVLAACAVTATLASARGRDEVAAVAWGLACVAIVALVRELPSCGGYDETAVCVPRPAKRVVTAIAVVVAIAGLVRFRSLWRTLARPAFWWPALPLAVAFVVGEWCERRGAQFAEEAVELAGLCLVLAMSIRLWNGARARC